MSDILNIAAGFLSGVATAVGTYIAVDQWRRSLPSIKVMATACSFRLGQEESDRYTCAFHIWLQNQSNVEYAVSDIQWRPCDGRLRRRIRGISDAGWERLYFDGTLNRDHWSHREPLRFGPYEHKHLIGYWKQMWTSKGHPEPEFWKTSPADAKVFDRLRETLHDNRVVYRVSFADGRNLVYKGKAEHGS